MEEKHIDDETEDIVYSEGPFGNLLKKVTGKKVDTKRGGFGVALDRADLRGGVANLLTDTWKGLQRLGSSGMESYASPQTMSIRRAEAPTSLTISISGVTSRVFSLVPPKAYVFTQEPEARIPDEVKKSNIITVPGLLLRIFRLVDNTKAPKTTAFISIDDKKGTVTPKAFTIKIGDNFTLGPLYMPPERINELSQYGGNSTAIVFPRKSIGSNDMTLTDSLMRSQGGALMFILNNERLQWVVSVEFSPFYEELQQQQQQGSAGSATTSPLARETRLVPRPPSDVAPPPIILKSTGATSDESNNNARSAIRATAGKPQQMIVVTGGTASNAPIIETSKVPEFDFRNYPDLNLVTESVTNDRTLSLVSATIGLTLVPFCQQPTVIALFAKKNVFERAQNIEALIRQMDRVLLGMDSACLRLTPTLSKINTLRNNCLMGATCLLASIYMKHNGRKSIMKREMKAEALLPTWNQNFIPLNNTEEYAKFPSDLFGSGGEPDEAIAKLMGSLPALDSVAHTLILNKYVTSKYLNGQESNSMLMDYVLKRVQIDVVALIKIAVSNNHGQESHLPAMIHILVAVYQAAGAYFLREATLTKKGIRSMITATNNAKRDQDVDKLKEAIVELFNTIREKENIKEPIQ